MSKPTMNKIYRSFFSLIFCLLMFIALYGCGTGPDVAAGSTPTPTPTPTLSSGSLTLSVTSNIVTFGTPVTATATLRDANGALVQNAVVTFAAASALVVFTPTSATALTNASGTASVILNTASVDSAGATSITASAPVTTGGTTSTITSTPVGIAVNRAAVTLGTLTLGQPSISAYGTSSVSVPVLVDSVPATVPISVAFTSSCVFSGKATLTSPVTTVLGTATSTYKDNNCASGTDVITASVTGATVSATITVALPATNNIQFVSATPAIIGTKGTGAATLPQSSLVKFKVVDINNNGKAGVLVDFSLLPTGPLGGVSLSSTSATSDADGYVTTSVTSGTVPTPVWVVAKVHSTPAILTQSNQLTITTGLPTQNFFSLSVQTHNIEGWLYDGVTSTITIIASDRLGNPVPDGTAINFISEGAQINPASCTTTNGTCTVTFRSSEYRPIDERTGANPGAVAALEYDGVTPIRINGGAPLFVKNGRVTILAYAVGEKSFVDANGNNSYDANETFYDLGDLYIDFNENGTWNSNSAQPDLYEQFINYAPVAAPVACVEHIGGGGTTPLPANYVDAPSKDTTCDGVWGLNYVRRSATMILSDSYSKISQDTVNMASLPCRTFSFWLMDSYYNPMPAETTVTTANNNVTFIANGATATSKATVSIIDGTPVLDTTHAGGTQISLRVEGGDCTVVPVSYPAGTVDIVITTPRKPQGNVTRIPVLVN